MLILYGIHSATIFITVFQFITAKITQHFGKAALNPTRPSHIGWQGLGVLTDVVTGQFLKKNHENGLSRTDSNSICEKCIVRWSLVEDIVAPHLFPSLPHSSLHHTIFDIVNFALICQKCFILTTKLYMPEILKKIELCTTQPSPEQKEILYYVEV